MNGWVLVALFVAVVAARLAANRWFARRWISNGMSPTRAAILSMAITYLPLLGLLVLGGWLTGRPTPVTALGVVLLAVVLPLAMDFGMRRAGFEYMDRYGVRTTSDARSRRRR